MKIETHKILDVKVKRTFFDKLFRLRTFSLVVHYRGYMIEKKVRELIEEEVSKMLEVPVLAVIPFVRFKK